MQICVAFLILYSASLVAVRCSYQAKALMNSKPKTNSMDFTIWLDDNIHIDHSALTVSVLQEFQLNRKTEVDKRRVQLQW